MQRILLQFFTFQLFFFCFSQHVWGQLDSVHYFSPLHGNNYTDDAAQFLYLSTPETTPFQVTISAGTGQVLAMPFISKSTPYQYSFGAGLGTKMMVTANMLNDVLTDKGIKAVGSKKFFCDLRVSEGDQAGAMTAKGRAALGTTFRLGHLPLIDHGAHFVSVVATANNTTVTFSNFAAGIKLREGGSDFTPPSSISVTLDVGETYVLAMYGTDNTDAAMYNGFFGVLVHSTKAIAVDCGSWFASPEGVAQLSGDIGFDQIVPLEKVGTEYIVLRGEGPSILEMVVLVAHSNNTKIYLHGNFAPYATLSAGERLEIPMSQYVNGCMYIKSSRPIFVYQALGGGPSFKNGALNFVPPLSCQNPSCIDNISNINSIGATDFLIKVSILAASGSAVTINTTNGPSPTLTGPVSVSGNPNYVMYSALGVQANATICANGPIQVCVAAVDEKAGWGGYYSGFEKATFPEITITSNACLDTLRVGKSNISGPITWYLNGQPLSPAPLVDSVLVSPSPGNYMAVGYYTTFCNDVVYDTAWFVVNPLFTVNTQTTASTCTGNDGTITVEAEGVPNSQYSIDGTHFQAEPFFDSLAAGPYTVIVQDANGCTSSDEAIVDYDASQPEISSIQLTPEHCDQHDASLVVQVTNGTPPYLFSVTGLPAQSSGSFTQLGAGTYIVIITDANGCERADTLEIPHIPGPYISNVQYTLSTSCGGDNGWIRITSVEHGSLPLIYEVVGIAVQTEASFFSLPSGLYQIIVTDAAGCQGNHEIEIAGSTTPSILQVSADSASCSLANGMLLIEAEGGVLPLQYGGSGLPFQSSDTLRQLPSGDFLAIVEDQFGCRDSLLVSIPAIPPPDADAEVSATTCGLDNGGIVLHGQGGTGPLQYSLDGVFYAAESEFSDLPAGIHTIYLLDEAECQTAVEVIVPGSEPLTIDEVRLDLVECGKQNGGLEVQASGGSGGRYFAINHGNPQRHNQFGGLPEGLYQIHVWDETGCADSTSRVLENDCVFIPNVFSPNNDGVNDLFQLSAKDNADFSILRYEVFDRWGNQVYGLPEGQHFFDGVSWWNGTVRGKEAAPGVYTYYIEINTGDHALLMRQGTVTIIR